MFDLAHVELSTIIGEKVTDLYKMYRKELRRAPCNVHVKVISVKTSSKETVERYRVLLGVDAMEVTDIILVGFEVGGPPPHPLAKGLCPLDPPLERTASNHLTI